MSVSETSSSVNGRRQESAAAGLNDRQSATATEAAAKPKKARKPRKKKEAPGKAPTVPAEPKTPTTNGDGQPVVQDFVMPPGRTLDQYEDEVVRYLIEDYIPFGMFTLNTGWNDAGKGALLALAISKATSVILFPSAEEGVGLKLKPRLAYYGVDQSKVFVPEGDGWSLPDCKKRLIQLAKVRAADLIAWDNIGSYIGDGKHNNLEEFVRPALEAANEVAMATGAACLGNRHPGKSKGNDVKGAGEFVTIPRVVLKMSLDPGSEDSGVIRHLRNTFGDGRLERHYRFLKEDGAPGIIVLGERLSDKEKKIIAVDDEEQVRIGKKKQAMQVIRSALTDGRREAKKMYDIADSLRIGHTTWWTAGR